ncbi:MAG: hypothetical protein P8Z70_09720, partial [Desulfuromonadales bacterium]
LTKKQLLTGVNEISTGLGADVMKAVDEAAEMVMELVGQILASRNLTDDKPPGMWPEKGKSRP